jgi:hypothetical protein
VLRLQTYVKSTCLLFLAALQDVSGGKPVMIEGVGLPLWGLEVDVEEGRREFAEFSAKNNTADQVCVWGGC